MLDLSAKTAIVTGGSRGIGAAISTLLAKYGCSILVNYKSDSASAKQVVSRIVSAGGRALAFQADVAQLDQCRGMVDACLHEWGKVDILVNNAGIWKRAPIALMTQAQLHEMVEIGLYGTFYPVMAAVPVMQRQRSGNIINISSTAGQRGEADHSHYAAVKGAVISATKSWAPELIEYNIRVNCVAPGWVDTDMSHDAIVGAGRDGILNKIPIGRVGTPDEIAGAVLYLVSDLSTFVVGEILNVNGGAVLCG